jgi:hypothetical protein
MVKTTQEYINGAAARFAADNANDDTVAVSDVARRYRAIAAQLRASGRVYTAALWEQAAQDIESGVEPVYGGE